MALTFSDDSNRTGQDLVICVEDNFSFDNRWKFTNDLVDYRTVEVWGDGSRLTKDCSGLKRVKIYGLTCEPMSALLERLSNTAQLEHLEIGTLNIERDAANSYDFKWLKRFSVDEIRVFDKFGEVPDATDTDKLKLNVYGFGNLVSLFFGKCLCLFAP